MEQLVYAATVEVWMPQMRDMQIQQTVYDGPLYTLLINPHIMVQALKDNGFKNINKIPTLVHVKSTDPGSYNIYGRIVINFYPPFEFTLNTPRTT